MADEHHELSLTPVGQAFPIGFSSPWLEILTGLWKTGRKVLRGLADEGMYEVLEYESTLELQDKRGEHALFQKREKVRYLQNNIIVIAYSCFVCWSAVGNLFRCHSDDKPPLFGSDWWGLGSNFRLLC